MKRFQKLALCSLAAFAGLFSASAFGHGWCSSPPNTNAGKASKPVQYSAFVVTDVSLGGNYYHNAQVTFTFAGDAKNIYNYRLFLPNGNGGAGQCLDIGDASVSVVSHGKNLKARFEPGLVFVSVDTYNGGIGFSSYVNGLSPVYPLGFLNGDVWLVNAANKLDLALTSSVSGRAWSCINYPPRHNSGDCVDPGTYPPLKTELGDFWIYQSYEIYDSSNLNRIRSNFEGSLNMGTFSVNADLSHGD